MFWRQLGTGEFTTMGVGILSCDDGGSLSITSDVSSSKSIEEVTMIEGGSLVSNERDATRFVGECGGVFNLFSGSGSTIGEFV